MSLGAGLITIEGGRWLESIGLNSKRFLMGHSHNFDDCLRNLDDIH